ncbi:MAG: DUF169 domain-containing protein, partial [Candidatus Thorarchaeota archaeon]
MGKFENLANLLNKYLKLSTFPVAVKLLEKSEGLNCINFLKKPDEEFAICQLFSYARYYGWTRNWLKSTMRLMSTNHFFRV